LGKRKACTKKDPYGRRESSFRKKEKTCSSLEKGEHSGKGQRAPTQFQKLGDGIRKTRWPDPKDTNKTTESKGGKSRERMILKETLSNAGSERKLSMKKLCESESGDEGGRTPPLTKRLPTRNRNLEGGNPR